MAINNKMKAIVESACAVSFTMLLVSIVKASDPVKDRVTALPDCAPLPSAMYSGYLPVTTSKALYYVLVES
jgi:hypothetical protein